MSPEEVDAHIKAIADACSSSDPAALPPPASSRNHSGSDEYDQQFANCVRRLIEADASQKVAIDQLDTRMAAEASHARGASGGRSKASSHQVLHRLHASGVDGAGAELSLGFDEIKSKGITMRVESAATAEETLVVPGFTTRSNPTFTIEDKAGQQLKMHNQTFLEPHGTTLDKPEQLVLTAREGDIMVYHTGEGDLTKNWVRLPESQLEWLDGDRVSITITGFSGYGAAFLGPDVRKNRTTGKIYLSTDPHLPDYVNASKLRGLSVEVKTTGMHSQCKYIHTDCPDGEGPACHYGMADAGNPHDLKKVMTRSKCPVCKKKVKVEDTKSLAFIGCDFTFTGELEDGTSVTEDGTVKGSAAGDDIISFQSDSSSNVSWDWCEIKVTAA